jgi:hypothetical protein
MYTACSTGRLAFSAARRSAFVVVVGMVVGVTAFSTCALQLLGSTRSAQNESSESSEYETSERIHVAVLQSRHGKTKGSALSSLQSVLQAADFEHRVRRALDQSRCRLPSIVFWSPTMRC